jgi:signal transduction histidine kinase
VAAHDLQQPIAGALIAADYADALLDRPDTSPAALRTQLAHARRCLREAMRLARDLLGAERAAGGAGADRHAPVDLAQLCDDARALVAAQAEAKGVAVEVVVAPALPAPAGDRDRLLQALTNLCGNAVHATPPGGRVGIAAALDGDAVRVSVVDTGPGLAGDDPARLFDRSWQAQRRAARTHAEPVDAVAPARVPGGTGLGLAIATWCVEAHGGTLVAERAAGGGLAVSFTVPVRRARPGA